MIATPRPRGTFDTPFGPMDYTLYPARIYLESPAEGITINEVRFHAGVALVLKNGEWEPETDCSCWLWDVTAGGNPADARQTFARVLGEILPRLVTADLLRLAKIADHVMSITSDEKQIASLEEEIIKRRGLISFHKTAIEELQPSAGGNQ